MSMGHINLGLIVVGVTCLAIGLKSVWTAIGLACLFMYLRDEH